LRITGSRDVGSRPRRRSLRCSTSSPRATTASIGSRRVKQIGLEWTQDGHFFWLSRDQAAGVARGVGLAGHAAYEISPPTSLEYNDVSFQITTWYADRAHRGDYATFEKGPRRLSLTSFGGYFVPLEKAPSR